MKRKLLLSIFLIISINLFSQESRIGIDLNYPLPMGENFIKKNYSGIIDLGVKYRIVKSTLFNAGVSLSSGIINSNSEIRKFGYSITTYLVQPKIFVELDVKSIKKIHPFMGMGYSFFIFDVSGATNTGVNLDKEDEVVKGLNITGGLIYDVTKKLFIQIQYDFINLQAENIPNIKFNTKIQFLKFGIGVKLNKKRLQQKVDENAD